MRFRGTRRSAAAAVVVAGALVLTGCARAAPEAADGARAQLADFEDHLEAVMEDNRSPKALWEALDPERDQKYALRDTSFEAQTGGPYAFDRAVGDDELSLNVYVSVLGSTGVGFFTSEAQRYICAAYVIDPSEQTFRRADIDCPEEALSHEDGLTDREEIDP